MHAAQLDGEIGGEIDVGDEIHVFYVIFVHLARLVSLDHLQLVNFYKLQEFQPISSLDLQELAIR